MGSHRLRVRGSLVLATGLGALVAGAVGWRVSDHLEANDDFCNACHLPNGTALHRAIRDDFDRVIPADLGGVHGRGLLDERGGDSVRCIDCHGGVGPVERTRVKLYAAKDALRYAVGSFEEPDGMPVRLSSAACLRCHERLRGSPAPGWDRESFHAIGAHAIEARAPDAVRCVDCHTVHERTGDAFAYFLERSRVHAGCRACHEDVEAILAP